jgi:2,4-dienoyl-CoA reductase-like NADH-dependent reductase (Old Yellow Enzyme family)
MDDAMPLFVPLQVGRRNLFHKTLRNRIVMPPMVVNRGLATPEGREWYGRRARGGVGLVIVEATNVISLGDAGTRSTLTAENLRPLAAAIHTGGALAAIQLFPGRRGQAVSPAELADEEIQQLIARYRTAAQVCAEAGFDGVEPHGAHGFLLNQFFSPVKNARTDAYGGTLDGRMRLALDIVTAIRPIADQAGMLILYRHTPVGPGYGIDESLALVEALVEAGVDILDISPASDVAPGDRAAPFVDLGVPVIAVNQLDRLERALEVLRERRATLVAVGRGLIADPDWPIKVREGRLGEIVTCTDCDECFADLRRGEPVGCTQWGA